MSAAEILPEPWVGVCKVCAKTRYGEKAVAGFIFFRLINMECVYCGADGQTLDRGVLQVLDETDKPKTKKSTKKK